MAEDYSQSLKQHLITETEWKIKTFSNLPSKGDYSLESGNFLLSDAAWCMEIYPNGQEYNKSAGWISLFLKKIKSPSACRLEYKFEIKKTDGSVYTTVSKKEHLFPAEGQRWGWYKVMKRSVLLGLKDILLPQDVLTIHLTTRVKYEQDKTPISGVQTLQEHFKEMYRSGYIGDIKITLKEKTFTAHKFVLVARSPVFRAMLELEMVEKISGAVTIEDCDSESFHDFLEFLYTGDLGIVSSNNALCLYFTADKYCVTELKKACSECLGKEISINSVCDVISLASLFEDMELQNMATEFFIKNADSIFKTEKWCSFLLDHRILAKDLLVKMAEKYKTYCPEISF